MKLSLRLGSREPLTREKARMCFGINLGFPGSGSLMAGRLVGYPQILMTLSGILLSMLFGLRFIGWFMANWSRLQNPNGDPMENLHELWLQVRWALLGIVLFAVAWLWGLVSGLMILAAARKQST